MFKIFIVEDEASIANIVKENLEKWGNEAKIITDFSNVLNEIVEYNPHLVLLDINLPAFDGFYWCQKIREISKVPVIFVSSRTANMDIVMAVNMGGDDFVQKPFSLDILLAKVNAILRRTYSYKDVSADVVEHDGVILNLKDYTVTFEKTKIELTKNEFKILNELVKNAGNIISRDRIMRILWEDESFVDDNTLTVNINRLRKKLEEIDLSGFITTKRGQGYIIK